MKVCIIGQGYIGLPTAALFSKSHCEVVGVDISEKIINNLNKGIVHIEEPGISDQIKNAASDIGKLGTFNLLPYVPPRLR